MKKSKLTKLVNKRTLKLLGLLATVLTLCVATVSALGAVLIVKQLRLVGTQQRTLPVLRRAAQLYLDQNAPQEAAPVKRPGLFHRQTPPVPVPEELPAEGTN